MRARLVSDSSRTPNDVLTAATRQRGSRDSAKRQPRHRKPAVATATAGAFRNLPRRRRGSERQDSARRNPARGQEKRTESVSPLSNSPDRPSPKRLPGGRAFNLGRSVLGALGNLTTHSRPVKPIETQYLANCGILRFNPAIAFRGVDGDKMRAEMHRGRVLLRPAFRRTSAEAIACRRAINLRRSVLGAPGTLGPLDGRVKRLRKSICALCEIFFTNRTYLRRALCALHARDQGFAEPGALSSTSPADLPLPRTASRESFVLLASRARRSGNLRSATHPCKGICRTKGRKLRTSGYR
jgi:hypothetical protein